MYGVNNVERSLRHYFKIMASLYKVEALHSTIAFPICVRMDDSTNNDYYNIKKCSIVFENYSDYRIGFPTESKKKRVEFRKGSKFIASSWNSSSRSLFI